MNNKNFLFVIVLLVIMFITNPTKDDFNKYVHELYIRGSEITISYEEAKENGAKLLYESGYTRTDFYIFSIIKTDKKADDVWIMEGYRGKEHVYIGFFKTFIRLT